MTQRSVVLLGSTGSIGTQALDVIRRNPHLFRVVGLAAGGGRVDLLAAQAAEFAVPVVGVGDDAAVTSLRSALPGVTVLSGDGSAAQIAALSCDVVVNGMSGASGLVPTLAALAAGSTLALANKESLIIGGPLVQAAAGPGQIVPVDSEHSALAQCLRAGSSHEVHRLILTASGGPFRGWTRESLRGVTLQQALAHPTWSMGPLVTINSATLMNKGLELIEAHLLFGVPIDRIDVVVHPQSVVHSMVEYVDGSTMAQASPPDMRLPIALGMGWPERVRGAALACDWSQAASWTFEPLDEAVFPAVSLARRAAAMGGVGPAVFNGADEIAVAAFLDGQLEFLDIVAIVGEVLDEHAATRDSVTESQGGNHLTLANVLDADGWARRRARELVGLRGDTRRS